MSARCATCGTEGSLDDEIRELHGLGLGLDADERARAVHLCRDCLERRDTKHWSLDGDEGQRLFDALADREPGGRAGRYSYLFEPGEELHLVRLRATWVADHGIPA